MAYAIGIPFGARFGRLIALRRDGADSHGNATWWCRCDCGRIVSVASTHLRRDTRSCGCLRKETMASIGRRNLQHGYDLNSPTYRSWHSMIQRCEDPNHRSYRNYGARAIKVCPRWRRSFATFLADMGERPDGKTVDRFDNAKDYGPGNCRWATMKEQAQNRRPPRRIKTEARSGA